jgi:hypothetical protein
LTFLSRKEKRRKICRIKQNQLLVSRFSSQTLKVKA